jgi:hypothetical protein
MKLVTALLLLFVWLGIATTARAEDFHYALPPQFTDLSTDAQRAKIVLPPEAVERAKKFRTYALAIENDVPIAEIDVYVGPARGSTADAIESAVTEGAKRFPKGFRLVKKEEIIQAGVTCGRVEFRITSQDQEVHKLVYILPLGTERALIGLEASPEHFEKVRPAFETSVSKVRGLRTTEDKSNIAATAAAAALLGLAFAIREALRRRRKRRSRAID